MMSYLTPGMTYDQLFGFNYGCKLRSTCNPLHFRLAHFRSCLEYYIQLWVSQFQKDMEAHFKYLNSNNTEEEVTYSMLARGQGQNQLVKNYKEADFG